jgi:hypothetical protein
LHGHQVPVSLVPQPKLNRNSIAKPELDPAVKGALSNGRIACDGAMDPELTAVLIDGIASQRTETDQAPPGRPAVPTSVFREIQDTSCNPGVNL